MKINLNDKYMQPKPKSKCLVDGCDEPYRAKGMCSKHYNQRLHQDNKGKKIVPVMERDCANLDCKNKLEKGQHKFCIACAEKYNDAKKARNNKNLIHKY